MSILVLGCGFTGMATSCESVFFSTTVIYALSKEGSSLMHVGQSRLMPRAEKRAIECCVSTDAQILQSILNLVRAAGPLTEQFYDGVQKHFTHAQTVYTRPSPFFWEGPGYEAKLKDSTICSFQTSTCTCTCSTHTPSHSNAAKMRPVH